ncbi:MAG: glycosyltransferase [Solirubrobacteraceae bacterium]
MRVAFDSRAAARPHGVGRYCGHLLDALRATVGTRGGEIVETHRPRQAYDVFHAPWMQGAMLHSPCPMVVTIHELGARTRLSERLRGGGIHLRLRDLAVQRATHVIVPTEALADEAVAELGFERERVVVIPAALDPTAATPSGGSENPSSPAPHAWTWQDVGRETWRVYESALAQPERPCVGRLGRRRIGTGGGQPPGGRAPRAIKQAAQ